MSAACPACTRCGRAPTGPGISRCGATTRSRTEAWLKDLIEHQTRFAGRAIQQIYHVDFYNQRGEMVAAADSWCFRTDRDQAREQGSKYDAVKARPPPHYSDDGAGTHLPALRRGGGARSHAALLERRCGRRRLPTMVKGPMTVTGFIAYAQGWGGLYIRANKLAWKQIHAHRGLGITNRFGIPDCPERVHWEPEFARMVGAPGAYDYGPERCSWLTHHLTNWMGDDGFLRRASCKIRRHNPEGDTLFIEGTVARSFVEDGRHLVEIAQEAHNQDGELSVVGSGVVELPVRQTGMTDGGGRWTRPLPPTPSRKGRGSGLNIELLPSPCGRGVGEGGQTPPKPATSRARISRQSAASACRSPSPADPAASRATRCASGRRAP